MKKENRMPNVHRMLLKIRRMRGDHPMMKEKERQRSKADGMKKAKKR